MVYGGLDIGTTSVKFSIYDQKGTLLAQAQQGYGNDRQAHPHQLNGSSVWNAVQSVIGEVQRRCSCAEPLSAFSVSSFGEAVVPLTKDGRELAPAFLYTAPEGKEELEMLLNQMEAKQMQRITGVYPAVIFPPVKINWFRNHTDIYEKTWKFVQFEDYILFRLTGETAISYSLASRSMALDIAAGEWSKEVLNAAGIEKEKLSTPVPSGTFVGKVRPKIAQELGLPSEVKVFTGGHDQMCGMIGSGAVSAGSAANASGTVECISAVLAQDVPATGFFQNNIYVSMFTQKQSRFTFIGTPVGGAILDWFTGIVNFGSNGPDRYCKLESECSSVPSGVLILPYFAGRGAPRRDRGATGSILGLKLNTERWEIYQGIMEALAFEMRASMDLICGQGVKIDEVRATGGGAKSELWLQLKADIYRRPVLRVDTDQPGTLGCAMIAAKADGAFASLQEAVGECVKIQKTFLPREDMTERFKEKYECYMRYWNN